MPRYDYTCEQCMRTEEVFSSFADFRPEIQCPACGGTAANRITGGAAAMVRGFAEYRFRPDKGIVGHSGYKRGRSAKTQERHYEQVLGAHQKMVKEKKSMTKDGWEMLGTMPCEMHDSICNHEGDKNVVMQDPVPFLKATGTFTGRKS